MNEKEIRFIDLFGGIGGFRYGLEKASGKRSQESRSDSTNINRKPSTQGGSKPTFNCVWYCDKDKYSVQTYNKNFEEQWKPTDITTVNPDSIPDFDMLCGGFPCQSFSIAGKRQGFQDIRGTMFFEICRIAQAKRPRLLFLENVKGLLSADNGRCFGTILTSLDELGYDVEWQVLNSKNFGVPQNRERVFIIGHLRGTGEQQVFPIGENDEAYPGKNTPQSSCLRSPLRSQGDKPMIVHNVYGGFNEGIRGHLSKTDGSTYCLDGGNCQAVELPVMNTLTEATGNRAGSSKEFLRSVDNINKSIGQIRRLTPVECERLQGFPDNWTDGVSDTQRYKQCGNAVTVNVIEAIGTKIVSQN